jgi:hypothetical protein
MQICEVWDSGTGCYKVMRNKLYPELHMRVYPNVSGLAAWTKNCKWYSSLLLGAVISLFCESV